MGDVCAALWHVATLGSPQPVYNVCDQSDSNQGSINQLLERIFGISTAFAGNVASSAVKVRRRTQAALSCVPAMSLVDARYCSYGRHV